MTIFNRRRLVGRDVFYPTVLYGVDLNADKAAIIAKFGAQSADKASLHILYSMQDDAVMIGGKRYLPPKEWPRQESDEAFASSVTFTDGNGFDFFLAGAWDGGETPISDDDYTDGFYNYLNKRCDDVYAVTSVARYSVIPHFEVMAK